MKQFSFCLNFFSPGSLFEKLKFNQEAVILDLQFHGFPIADGRVCRLVDLAGNQAGRRAALAVSPAGHTGREAGRTPTLAGRTVQRAGTLTGVRYSS